MKLLQLPYEIHLAITRALDYKSLLNLSAINKHFREIFLENDKQLLRHALLDLEDEHCSLAWKTSLTSDNRLTPLPCYGCLRLLLKCYFTSYEWYSSSTREGVCAFRRRCVTCKVKGKQKFTRASRILRNVPFSGLWAYCAGCKLITHIVPLHFCGIYHHQAKATYIGSIPVVPADFRCTFCCAKT